GEGELAVEAVEPGEPLVLEQRMDDLGVAARPELDALPAELLTQLGMVVDLAVVDQDAAGLAGQRLPTVCEVDDRKPRRDEPGAGIEEEAEAVGAAMADRSRHPQQRLLLDRLPGVGTDDPRDAAHVSSPAGTAPPGRAGRRLQSVAGRSRRRRQRP